MNQDDIYRAMLEAHRMQVYLLKQLNEARACLIETLEEEVKYKDRRIRFLECENAILESLVETYRSSR